MAAKQGVEELVSELRTEVEELRKTSLTVGKINKTRRSLLQFRVFFIPNYIYVESNYRN